jgi:hypothetical protein
MSEHPINDDELMVVDERLRAEAAEWRIDPPADLHERTMGVLEAVRGQTGIAGRIGRVPSHGMALAAASLALLITTWAALILQSPPATIEPEDMGAGPGEIVQSPAGAEPGADQTAEVLADLLAAASLEGEIADLETDARTISTMMTRQVRLISGQQRQ